MPERRRHIERFERTQRIISTLVILGSVLIICGLLW